MQQTETYKLNLIERTDPFLPDALNENTQKVEDTLAAQAAAEAAARDAADAALDQRVTALEGRRLFVGKYTGTGTSGKGGQHVELGFYPAAVLICRSTMSSDAFLATRECPLITSKTMPPAASLTLEENGFSADWEWNGASDEYSFIAIL